MAATTTYTTYEQIGIREDLSNAIYNIAPIETPFQTAIQQGAPAKSRKVEWQTDTLATATIVGAVEGADPTYYTATPTVRMFNYCAIFQRGIIVSGTAQAVTTAGREEELAYQISKRGRELKRSMEKAMCGNYATIVGTNAAARQMAGFEAWIKTNDTRGSGGATAGADGGWTTAGSVKAATDGSSSSQRTLTEARLKAVILNCWNSGGQPSIVMVGPVNKQKVSAFTGITTKYSDFGNNPASPGALAIVAAADIYLSDFGKLRIIPNRFSRERTAMVFDPDYWSRHVLRPFAVNPIAKTGDAEKRQLITELTLVSRNEASSGVVADLLTT